ncbi:MAG: lipoyl synthase [Gammaproteobacteria bacterium]|nr:MAG: lipoyl synthase [Gammaproteobacteria bacterium]
MAQTPFVKPPFDHSGQGNLQRMPLWIRQRLGGQGKFGTTEQSVHHNRLHTVCEEARCPNITECWSRGTATFMLLGDTCTRACGFCAVKTGNPCGKVDEGEPQRVAEAVANLGLDYIVLTSVNRDDLPDGGAGIFADTLTALNERIPGIGLEILTPDFYRQQNQAVERIMAAINEMDNGHLVWGHNVETVPSLYKEVRKGADYQRSLDLLKLAAEQPRAEAKSAIMLGLGETREEVIQVLEDLVEVGVSRMTIGQYLRPSRYHLPVREYLHPDVFADYEEQARSMGFSWVKAGPMVRSSYHAEEKQGLHHG